MVLRVFCLLLGVGAGAGLGYWVGFFGSSLVFAHRPLEGITAFLGAVIGAFVGDAAWRQHERRRQERRQK